MASPSLAPSNRLFGSIITDMGEDLILYDYWRSSAAYRIRLALNLKGLDYQQVPINLATAVSEQKSVEYLAVNPQGRVPALVHHGQVLSQSLAICDYLEEVFPDPALLPASPLDRAGIRALAQIVACDIHPLNNLSVLNFLAGPMAASESSRADWYRQWIDRGFNVFEQTLHNSGQSGLCCFGDQPGLADLCLIPQVNHFFLRSHVSSSPRHIAPCAQEFSCLERMPRVKPSCLRAVNKAKGKQRL